MRVNLTTLLILLTLLQVSAASFGQRLTMKESRTSVDKVIREIKRQTGYDVLLITPKLKSNTVVAANFENASLEQVMRSLLAGRSLDYTIEKKTIIIKEETPSLLSKVKEALGIPIVVTGRVSDSTGLALPGASIKIKDKVIKSDSQGQFTFSAERGDVVTISFVGYQSTSFTVFEGMPFQVVTLLAAEGKLREVVVNTGYEKISKERSTGSFDFIDNKKFNEQIGTTVLERLAGIASSVAYNKSSTGDPVSGLTIRGISTINGGRTPLIVVDNFPYNGDLNNINPNDVESITILKDAAASSIWGAKAGNGVIVITTKRGRFGQKIQVNVNSNVSLVSEPDLFSMKSISSSDLIDVQKFLFSRGAYNSKERNTRGRPYLPPVVELLIKARDGKISEAAASQQIEAMKQYDLRNDMKKYLYMEGVNQQYALDLSGGSDMIAYRFGAGYDNTISNLDAGYKRINLSSVNTFRPVKNLEIMAGFNFTQSTTTSGRPSYADLTGSAGIPLYGRLMDDQGNQMSQALYRQPYIDTIGHGKLLDWQYYPLEDYKHTYSNQNQIDLVLNTSADYRINKMLKLNVTYQYEKQKGNYVTTNDLQSYYTRNLINTFTQIPADGSALVRPVPLGSILDYSNPSVTSHQGRGVLNFDHTWGKNQIVALAGAEIRTATTAQLQNRVYGYDPNTSVTAAVDNVNVYRTIMGSSQTIPYSGLTANLVNRFVSVFANAAYTYDDKYTLSASARRDASNIFGATTNNRWKPLWSAGAGWEISKESFYASDLFPYLKLRGSYGFSGNVNSKIVGITTIGYYGTSSDTQQPYSDFRSYDNPDLRWENVGMTNIALDFNSKNNRVSGSVEYFHKKTKDLYAPVQTDYTSIPVFQLTKNAASTAGHGVDVQLHSANFNGQFKWNTDLNFTWYRDRVVDYYSKDTISSFMAGNSAALSHGGNNAVYGIYSYPWAGLSPTNGAPQGYLNGKVSTNYTGILNASYANLIYSGPSTAPFFGNIANTVQWRSLSLTINIVYKFGYYFMRQSINYSGLADGNGNSDFSRRWQQAGDEQKTNVPAFIYPIVGSSDSFYNASNVLVEKGDNVRIDYIKLNYALSRNLIKRIGLGSVNVYLGARNLGPIWTANKDGIDPDNQLIKSSKVFSFGLNASF